jgi:hypothetical protein
VALPRLLRSWGFGLFHCEECCLVSGSYP